MGPSPSAWSVELSGLEGAVLCVASLDRTGERMVAVGGDPGSNDPPILLERTSAGWIDVPPPTAWLGAMWWAHLVAPDDLWIVGARMQIAHGPLGALAMIDAPDVEGADDLTLFGVWGSSRDDVWIVGGEPSSPNGHRGVVLHYDGQAISQVAVPRAIYKVWGASAREVMMVGDRSWLRFDGEALSILTPPVDAPLITIHGRAANEVFAVGGFVTGLVIAYDGAAWSDISETGAPPLNGVAVDASGRVVAAGYGGYLAVREGGSWRAVETDLRGLDIHSVQATPSGIYAAGGRLAIGSGARHGFIGCWRG
ncbi:MAG: hypothetical protein IT384_03560 [Deltaproteobacteria bacterium]|nr:hypothetical protein [Deltaproteobacteria bacterium]